MTSNFMEQIRSDYAIADKLTQKFEGGATITINRDKYDTMVKALLAANAELTRIKKAGNWQREVCAHKIREKIKEATDDK